MWQYVLVVWRRLGYVSFLENTSENHFSSQPPMDKVPPFHRVFHKAFVFQKQHFLGVHVGTSKKILWGDYMDVAKGLALYQDWAIDNIHSSGSNITSGNNIYSSSNSTTQK